ncbi:MAG: thioredoxin [Firmicutes bacterium]|nr:thioredoxin [Bacillota bacterium]MDD7603175.1 thioredoxin [Bacillota bacterium]MDY5856601.1 thioredoxin [Anaerovoracaceae bacterium]
MIPNITNLTKDNFDAEVLQSDKPVLVDFWASWCGPCKMIAPEVEQIALERDDIKVCKVNVDEEGELSIRYGVMSIPTLLVFQNGELVTTAIGYRKKEEILELLK